MRSALSRSVPCWPRTTRVLNLSSRARSSEARACVSRSAAKRPCRATVQFAERWIAYVLAIGFAALLVFLLAGADTGKSAALPGASGWSLACVVMPAGPFSYVPMPADYTRYLPRATSLRSLTWYGALGGFASSVAQGVAGMAAATQTDMTDAVAGTEQLLPEWVRSFRPAKVAASTTPAEVMTPPVPARPSRTPRAWPSRSLSSRTRCIRKMV